MKIHTIGDSHCLFGWGNDVEKHHLGPILCFSFGRDTLNRCNIHSFNINDGDSVIFCLGEIDCRCHVFKHISTEHSYQSNIDIIVDSYFNAITTYLSSLQRQLKYVCVYNVVPPVQKYNTDENPEFPYLGSDEERKTYVLYFNSKLKQKCLEYNFVFFDIYDKYTDQNGFLLKDLSDGHVHIKNGIHINNFIKEHLVF